MSETKTEQAIGVREVRKDTELIPAENDWLSASQVRAKLEERGVPMAPATFSEFVNTEGIAEALQARGTRGKWQFPLRAVDILISFYPEFKRKKGRLPQANDMLRAFLQTAPDDLSEFVKPEIVPQVAVGSDFAKAEAERLLEEHKALIIGLGASNRPLSAQEAADYLGVSVATLRRTIPPYIKLGRYISSERWKLSDLLRDRPDTVYRGDQKPLPPGQSGRKLLLPPGNSEFAKSEQTLKDTVE